MNNSKRMAVCILAISLLLSTSCAFFQSSTLSSNETVTYGYAKSIPIAIIPPENGLQIKMHDIVYTTVNDIWVLGGYTITATSPSGKTTEIQLLKFEYNENLSVIGYSVLENGKSVSAPPPEKFHSDSITNGIGLYPSEYDVALFLSLPCSVASSNEENTQEQFFGIWVDHIARNTVSCSSGEKYVFSFSEFDYMDKPSLKPSSVLLSVSSSK